LFASPLPTRCFLCNGKPAGPLKSVPSSLFKKPSVPLGIPFHYYLYVRVPITLWSSLPFELGMLRKVPQFMCVGNLDQKEALDASEFQRDERNVLSALLD